MSIGVGSITLPEDFGTDVMRPMELVFACSDETSPLSVGASKVTFRMPRSVKLTDVRASVTSAPAGASIIVDINADGTSILSSLISIDAGEKTSTTSASPFSFYDDNIPDDAEVTIDIDQVGSASAGAGLKVSLIGIRS